jgi:cold shock CspA family protein
MDEYRPFPSESEQPPDEPADDALDEALDDTPEAEPDQDQDQDLDQDLEAEAEAPRPMAERDDGDERDAGAGRQERAAPNLDHPGGHLHGTVARLNKPRRFGFLRADDGVEVFFHASAIDSGPNAFDALRPGQEVEFDCHQDEQGRGLAASVVTITGEPPPEPPRQPRQPRAERAERATARERRGASGGERWHVAVLRERFDMPVATQLERLLNERVVKPGNFTLGFVDREEGVDCWVAYFSAVEGS